MNTLEQVTQLDTAIEALTMTPAMLEYLALDAAINELEALLEEDCVC